MTSSRAGMLVALGVAAASTFCFVFYVRSAARPRPAACEPTDQERERPAGAAAPVRLAAQTSATGERLETDPRSPAYQPARLARVVGFQAVFDSEPRDPAWAGPVEAELSPLLATSLKQIVPDVTSAALDCRTTLCRISWTLAGQPTKQSERRLAEAIRQIFPGSGRVVGSNSRIVLWQNREVPDIRDLAVFLPAARKRIQTMTDFLRSADGDSFLAKFGSSRP
jgi:hypothetical protein